MVLFAKYKFDNDTKSKYSHDRRKHSLNSNFKKCINVNYMQDEVKEIHYIY